MLPSVESKTAPISPAPLPEPVQPVHVTPAGRPSRRSRWVVAAVLVVVLAAAAGWALRQSLSKPQVDPNRKTTRVVRGVLERTLRLTGTTTTDNYATIAAPL